MHCIYVIATESKAALRLTFDQFDVESVANHDHCEHDSLSLYETLDTKTLVPQKLVGR